ncbi:hypothetical protein KM043_012714 [Ampulex compressa]|nr:hypothetical protein KM043_012714 [Ampulex compressa]
MTPREPPVDDVHCPILGLGTTPARKKVTSNVRTALGASSGISMGKQVFGGSRSDAELIGEEGSFEDRFGLEACASRKPQGFEEENGRKTRAEDEGRGSREEGRGQREGGESTIEPTCRRRGRPRLLPAVCVYYLRATHSPIRVKPERTAARTENMCAADAYPGLDRPTTRILSRGRSLWCIWCILLLALQGGGAIRPVITTRFGQIRGKWSWSTRGVHVANFLGIPYARPPVGELRFKDPEAWNTTWDLARDASKDGPMCVQQDTKGNVVGEEDCLYLNVFMPVLSGYQDKTDKFPVMVFVHGGAFNTGSSDSTKYAPDYLMDQKLILVTLNYRLNVFGFFSTASKASPGNYGVKDILTGLHWIQENIESFLGDPGSVTLVGQSAGASAVHFLALSNKTEGLFHRYVLHSGSALARWAFHPRRVIRKASLDMARLLGCRSVGTTEASIDARTEIREATSPENATEPSMEQLSRDETYYVEDFNEEDDEETVNCMRSIAANKIMRINEYYHVWRLNPWCIFGPTVEEDSENAVITSHPMASIEERLFRDIPWMIGVVENEGLVKSLGFITNPTAADEMLSNFENYLPYVLEYHEIVSNTTVFANSIEDFYFEGNISETLSRNITEMLGDALVTWPSYQALKYQSELMNSSCYFFLFSYNGTFSHTFASGIPVRYGIAHSDDINYLFPVLNNMYSDQMLHNTEEDRTMINVMTEMWFNFAKDGVPKAWRIVDWPDYRDQHEYVRLGVGASSNVTVERDFLPERMEFWEKLADKVFTSLVELDLIRVKSPLEDDSDFAIAIRADKSIACLLFLVVICFY